MLRGFLSVARYPGDAEGLLSELHEVQVLHTRGSANNKRFIRDLGFAVWDLEFAIGKSRSSTLVPRPRNAIIASSANHFTNGKNSNQTVTS